MNAFTRPRERADTPSSRDAKTMPEYTHRDALHCRSFEGVYGAPTKLSYAHYRQIVELALDRGYGAGLLRDAIGQTSADQGKALYLRHDIDHDPRRAVEIARLEAACGVRSTYFFRTNANDYNLFSYDVRRLIDELQRLGHDIGLHAEPVDYAHAREIPMLDALREQIALFRIVSPDFRVVASHNDMTPYNNLPFLQDVPAQALLAEERLVEAYSASLGLFDRSTYVTDSYRYWWRVFRNGTLASERACVCDLLLSGEPLIYMLTHPENWYRSHYHLSDL